MENITKNFISGNVISCDFDGMKKKNHCTSI